MTSASGSVASVSPAARTALLAAWGFLLAKGLVIAHLLTGAWGALLVPAVLAAFGADVLVVLALWGFGRLVERLAGPTSWTARLLPPLLAFLAGLYAILNVVLVVEVGRPVTIDMLRVDVGTREAGAMLGSPGGILALGGAGLFALTAFHAPALVARRAAIPARTVAFGLVAYAVVALATVRAWPSIASIYGLHRNAVSEIAWGALAETGAFGAVGGASIDLQEVVFEAPPGANWTAPVAVAEGRRPKHLVLWLSESTGARYTSLFDPSIDTTPTVARLRDNGLLFTRYYANAPLSEKAIFGILCGYHPYPGNRAMAAVNPRIACPSLAETLVDRGYRAGFFTGALFGFGDKQKLLSERGFDVLVDGESVPGRERYWRNGWGVDDAAIVAEAIRWIDERPDPDQPLFLMVAPIIPHVPYGLPPDAPTPFGHGSRFGPYLNGLRYSDAMFARLHAALVERGLADDTLFVWVGDHGEAFEQHPGNTSHASFVYEENLHVPLLLVNPGLFPEPVASARMGSHVDLLPTLFDLLGQPVPAGGEGRSLVADDFAYRPVFFGAFVRDRLGGLRDGDFKYIYNFETGFEEVYDLSTDPLESVNLVDRVDVERVGTWRAWVISQQTRQKAFLEGHPVKGPSYLARVLGGMAVFLEDGDRRVACTLVRNLGVLGCPETPEEVTVALDREKIRAVNRECLSFQPPPTGRLVVEFSSVDPPGFIGAGLLDSSRQAGGTPLEVTWRIGALDPIAMVLDDPGPQAYQAVRVTGAGDEPVDVRVEIRSDDWANRRGCLVLSP